MRLLLRREFLAGLSALAVARRPLAQGTRRSVATVRGPVDANDLGVTLVHEHVLVDFIGADQVGRHRYDAEEAFKVVLPHLAALKERNVGTLVECTPAFLGRDPQLLRRLSEASGLHIVTNTGYYGARKNQFLPAHALEETAERLAERWLTEWRQGIERTGVRPAFLKTGVDAGPLSSTDRKLIVAAVHCHRRTGLRIHCHTGDGVAAMDILSVLQEMKVAPSAYVWVHAQNAKDRALHLRAAKAGVWIELDGVSETSRDAHLAAVMDLKKAGLLERVLISQDAGWYRVGEPGGGRFRPFTYLLDAFVPALREAGLGEADVRTLLVANPARVLSGG
jgi:predicted metal-dependent phosphotriesterase family hydrolase